MGSGRTISLAELRKRGQNDEQIKALGGVVHGLNVLFEAGESYDKAAEILKLKPLPKREFQTAIEWLKVNGPKVWAKFHTTLQTIPLKRETVEAFIHNEIINPLPCASQCKPHARKLISELPPDVTSRRNLLNWSYDFHDGVNLKRDVPLFGREAGRQKWETNQPQDTPNL